MNAMASTPTNREHDALLEIVNIGNGNALSTLSRMLGGARLDMAVPELITDSALASVAALNRSGVMVSMDVTGPVPASMTVLLDLATAEAMAAVLMRRAPTTLVPGGEVESAIIESVNIVSCSFLGAFASLVPGVFIPKPPVVVYGHLATLLSAHMGQGGVAIGNAFTAKSGDMAGYILWVAPQTSAMAAVANMRAISST